jgi:hypothetical protein
MENELIDKFIVITSIHEPSIGVISFSQIPHHQLIVVGDAKTPSHWNCQNVVYLPIEKQKNIDENLDKVLPYNHYSRKMIGYLYAIRKKAAYIMETDDDNIPKLNFYIPDFQDVFETLLPNQGFVNIYQFFSHQKIWARGLPLSLVNTAFEQATVLQSCKVGIWQGLIDENPDVDAIYRLTNNTPCFFEERSPIVLGKKTVSPFNSQNTVFKKELFSLLYLPAFVSFRFTDILRSLVAQPILWQTEYLVGFTKATVLQKRNPHDNFEDFLLEIPMYRYSEKIIEIVESVVTSNNSIENNLFNAYEALLAHDIVEARELHILSIWLQAMASSLSL